MTSKFEAATAEINKRFGKGTIMPLNASSVAEGVDVISTGNAIIDKLTGIGGIARSRVTEIYGPEAGGKTTLALQILAEAQKIGQTVFIDAEQTLDLNYAQALGVNTDQLWVSQPTCGEDALDITEELIKSGEVVAVVIDSVAALVPRGELEGEMGDATMGAQARLMSQAMRKLVGVNSTTNTALIFINQIRAKFVAFGSPETTTGGGALKYFASLRIDVRRIQALKKGDHIIGNKTKVKIAKNKFAPPFKEAEVPLLFGKGFINQ